MFLLYFDILGSIFKNYIANCGSCWVYLFIHLFVYRLEQQNGSPIALISFYCNVITLLQLASSKVASVLVLFVFFGCHFSVCVYRFALIGFLLLLWWHVLQLFILLCFIEGTVDESKVVNCTLELAFRRSSDLFSVTELTFLHSQGTQLLL